MTIASLRFPLGRVQGLSPNSNRFPIIQPDSTGLDRKKDGWYPEKKRRGKLRNMVFRPQRQKIARSQIQAGAQLGFMVVLTGKNVQEEKAMTLVQITHVVACAELGSLTKAANAQYTSVSTLSKSIAALEEELGYDLFIRSAFGLTLSEKGVDFVRHAYTILSEVNHINNISRPKAHITLSIACTQIPQAFIAWQRFCQQTQNDSSISSSLYTCPFPECLERIIKHKSQIAIVSMPLSVDSIQKKSMQDAGITVRHLCKQTLNVNVRADHPVLRYYTPGKPFDFSLLKNYPYISYMAPEDCAVDNDDFSQSSFFNTEALDSQKRFRVNNLDWKSTMVGTTDAFSIGIAGPLSWKERYGWECIPLPGYESNMYCIYLQTQPITGELEKYLKLLDEVNREPLG